MGGNLKKEKYLLLNFMVSTAFWMQPGKSRKEKVFYFRMPNASHHGKKCFLNENLQKLRLLILYV